MLEAGCGNGMWCSVEGVFSRGGEFLLGEFFSFVSYPLQLERRKNENLASVQIVGAPRLEVVVRAATEDGVLGW
jgi:hypothetical protein